MRDRNMWMTFVLSSPSSISPKWKSLGHFLISCCDISGVWLCMYSTGHHIILCKFLQLPDQNIQSQAVSWSQQQFAGNGSFWSYIPSKHWYSVWKPSEAICYVPQSHVCLEWSVLICAPQECFCDSSCPSTFTYYRLNVSGTYIYRHLWIYIIYIYSYTYIHGLHHYQILDHYSAIHAVREKY